MRSVLVALSGAATDSKAKPILHNHWAQTVQAAGHITNCSAAVRRQQQLNLLLLFPFPAGLALRPDPLALGAARLVPAAVPAGVVSVQLGGISLACSKTQGREATWSSHGFGKPR